MCMGLDTINVKMIKKVITAPAPPKAERAGDSGRSAIKIPNVILITPVIPENILVLTDVNAQEKKRTVLCKRAYGLSFMNGKF